MMKHMEKIRTYYQLAKPGIVYGNLLALISGFLLASDWKIHWSIAIGVIFGTSFVIASGCVFNNFIDRGVDAQMTRTKRRSLVTGTIPISHALVYATILGIAGFGFLIHFTNIITVIEGLIGYGIYIIVYGAAKRHSIYSTIIGSISGAMPLLAGYTAVSNRIDTAAVLLFLMMVWWQMPHFYAISLFRLKDYTNAKLHVWPVEKGSQSTKIQMLIFVILFTLTSLILSITGYTGKIYFIVMAILGIIWIRLGIKGFRAKDETKWARSMFFFSLISLLIMCIMIPANIA